jgi:hypothetical protein
VYANVYVIKMCPHPTFPTYIMGIHFYYSSLDGNFLMTRIMTRTGVVHQNDHFDEQVRVVH